MSDKLYKEIGKNIETGVKDALVHGNWDGLNDAISKSVDTALDDFGDKINETFFEGKKSTSERTASGYSDGDKTREWENRLHEERKQRRHEIEEERERREAQRAARRTRKAGQNNNLKGSQKNELGFPYQSVGEVSSNFYSITGGIGLGFVGVVSLVNLVSSAWAVSDIALAGAFGVIFGGMLAKGVTSSNLNRKADRYAKLIGSKGYIEIKTLALLTNQSPRGVLRDIRKMLKKGFFPEGHLDEGNTTFILTDNVFHQYLETRENAVRMQRQSVIDSTAREVDSEFENLSPEQADELRQMIAEGNSYITRVHELNDLIPGEVMSEKLDRLEGLLNEIFARVKEQPDQMSKMHELMDYYLPTAIKIVEAYSEYDDVSEPGPEMVKAQSDIENTVETINGALSKLLNNLFKDSVWDVTTDAQVLKTVLAQKGLSSES